MPAEKEIHKSLAKKRDGRTNGGSQMLYQNPHFVCVCVLTALGQQRVVLWSGCVPYGMNSGCLLSPSLF